MRLERYQSWGRYPRTRPRRVVKLRWRHDTPDFAQLGASVLPYAYGRSYGDSCLNDGGVLLDTTGLDRFIAFDEQQGLLTCEAGVQMLDVLALVVPRGWFLPVSAGTKFVSVGGAMANDVHGKNHHVAGTFGRHVTQFELLRSDGVRLVCSPTQNADMFAATIGGLGLTGVIMWAQFQLKRVASPLVRTESIRFRGLEEFFALSAQSEADGWDYTVAWVDCTAEGRNLGRGLFSQGEFYDPPMGTDVPAIPRLRVRVPFDLPDQLVNPMTVRVFNELYYRKQVSRVSKRVGHYDSFFYPLDAIHDWHRVYGKRGFLQYQVVVPYADGFDHVAAILRRIAFSGRGSPLVVLKTFGALASPGMLSFPRPGVTLALDFPYEGAPTLRLLDELDRIVFDHGGAIYPAKDARMSPQNFRRSFPNWEAFAAYVDPCFSSSFWRRVGGEDAASPVPAPLSLALHTQKV